MYIIHNIYIYIGSTAYLWSSEFEEAGVGLSSTGACHQSLAWHPTNSSVYIYTHIYIYIYIYSKSCLCQAGRTAGRLWAP